MTTTASEVSDGDTSNDSTLSLHLYIGQDTSDFTINDVTVSNGNLSNFQTVNSKVYTVAFTPSDDGACTTDVAENKYTDTAGSNNEAADQTLIGLMMELNPAAFTVGSVVTAGGTIVSGYWNSTYLGLDITVLYQMIRINKWNNTTRGQSRKWFISKFRNCIYNCIERFK